MGIQLLDPTCSYLGLDSFDNEVPFPEVPVLSSGTYPDLVVSWVRHDHFEFCVGAGETLELDLTFSHALGNIDARFLYSTGGFTFGQYLESTTDNESLVWTNTTGEDLDCRLRINVTEQVCNQYDLSISGANTCSFTSLYFCDPMDPNSTGQSTTLTANSDPHSPSGLHLEVTQGPRGQFAYVLVGSGANDPGLMNGAGRFCLAYSPGNAFGRFNRFGTTSNSIGRFFPNGVLHNIAGTSNSGTGFDVPTRVPIPFFEDNTVGLLSSPTWSFQVWHRDTNGVSNYSNGITVQF